MIAEADAENTGEISYPQFKHVIAEQKKNQAMISYQVDTLDYIDNIIRNFPNNFD